MNEIQLIRQQLALESQHALETARNLQMLAERTDVPTETFSAALQAGADYLAWNLTRFEERDELMRELIHERFGADDPARGALDEVLARHGTSREALTQLERTLSGGASAPSSPQLLREFVRFLMTEWASRRTDLGRLFEQHAGIANWRSVAGIDADSILEERLRYGQFRAKFPAAAVSPG